jgi:hypothetical protein
MDSGELGPEPDEELAHEFFGIVHQSSGWPTIEHEVDTHIRMRRQAIDAIADEVQHWIEYMKWLTEEPEQHGKHERKSEPDDDR